MVTPAAPHPVKTLTAMGQSIWLDYIRRDLTRSGDLANRVHATPAALAVAGSIFGGTQPWMRETF